MPSYDFHSPRLHIEGDLAAGKSVRLEAPQAHYLLHVLRLGAGDSVLVFNGRDGEWLARLTPAGKRALQLDVIERTRPQTPPGDLDYVFAPLKSGRLDYMTQKAVEMGASRLCPVLTQHTQVARFNPDRLRANAVEAAEQCGILQLPQIAPAIPFERWIEGFDQQRLLVFCDEAAEVQDPLAALATARRDGASPPLSVVIGPEGGFSSTERDALLRVRWVMRVALGPRILRADTAAVAALTLVQAVLGDWR